MFLHSTQGFFCIDQAANRIAFVWIDGYDLFAPSLTVGVLHGCASGTHEQSLHLPDRDAIFQLFGKLCGIGGGVERLELESRGRLMMAVVVAGY